MKGSFDTRFLAKAIVASTVLALAVFLSSSLVSDRLITLLPYTTLGMALYFLFTKILKLLGPNDKAFLAHLLPQRLQ
jgi:hypothetical protein